ncbi:tetratricopeptide repeat protein [Motiliproteus sp. SC1-56]|uniref:CDC27 family protein n=1 Tax=Motiliproteus sp. SC1-56 TaxID=2799565 RepID=UPI001A9081F8|nr:tetratricopeptide repeat protein [Motiliproteus sp. SC1-56]
MPAPIDYASLKVLLIDSSGNFRATIKRMLEDIGFKQVTAETISPAVIDWVSEGDYDLILIGHNIQDRYSGLQLLEEARYRGVIKPTCSWVLMTSDASQQSVLFAIEIQPDEVLTKPFTMVQLRRRLQHLCRRRAALAPIERAVERGAVNRAISLCDTVLPKSDPNYTQAQLIKGRLLLDSGDYTAAKAIFERYYWSTQDLQPGYFLARCHFLLGEYETAQQLLERLIAEHDLLTPAYDLLAQVLEATGNPLEAQEVLRKGAQRSPLGMGRQLELGRLGTLNQDLSVAEHAYRKAVQLCEQSCHASPVPFLQLANVHRLQALESGGAERRDHIIEVERLLERAQRRFRDDSRLAVQTQLVKGQLHEDLKEPDQAQQCYQEAHRLAAAVEGEVDIEQMRQRILAPPSPHPAPPPAAVAQVPESGEKPAQDPVMSRKVNRIGVRNYLAGKPSQAIRYFGLAFEYDAQNGEALLNLAQLFLEAARDTPSRSQERMRMFQRYIRLAQRLPLTGAHKEKLERLRRLGFLSLEELPEGPLGQLLR